MSLHLVPLSFRDACSFVALWHRHHRPPVGCKFCVGVADEDGVLRGVLIAGRPVARVLDDGMTLEVTRTATDGTHSANSMLYGAARRAVWAMGYRRLITYTQRRAIQESRARQRAARPPAPHGTRTRRNYGCSCDECLEAANVYARALYARRKARSADPTSQRPSVREAIEQLIARGRSNAQIMAELGVSYEIVREVRDGLARAVLEEAS